MQKPLPKLAFKHVDFSYAEKQPLTEDFSLDVPEGQMVAIVGPTGAGKTTIINLLERFYDVNNGKIYLDGKKTRSMSREDLRGHIAMVLQAPGFLRGRFLTISSMAGRMPATKKSIKQPKWPEQTASSVSCLMAMRRSLMKKPQTSPRGSVSC